MDEYRIHECPYQSAGVSIEYSESPLAESTIWQLSIFRTATEADLKENHYLENEGDNIWRASVTINYCPFCGVKLVEDPISKIQMIHVDSSGWYSKVS